MRGRQWMIGGLVLAVLALGGVGWAWYSGLFDSSVHDASVQASETSANVAGTFEEALALARIAQAKLEEWKGYRCIYLRDEFIDNELKENYLKLAVRHAPFSVGMEWVEPVLKRGRTVVYVEGKNGNKMVARQLGLKRVLDLEESISRKESRHTIKEAGLKNLVHRFITSWEAEQKTSDTTMKYVDVTLEMTASKQHYSVPTRCVESIHTEASKGKYAFYRVKLYFNKADGLPVRMEGYDWPTQSYPEGRLLERYTYIDVKPEPAPGDGDFPL